MPGPGVVEAIAIVLAAAVITGCASLPRGTAAVDDVTVRGNEVISGADIEKKIATTASPKFLGLFRGVVYNYEIFDRGVLQRDLERVQRYYRARGFYEAKVRAGRIVHKSDRHVEVTIEVEEGPPVLIGGARIDGSTRLAPAEAKAVREAMTPLVKPGARFEEDPFRRAEDAMQRALTDRGYAWAKVARRADVDLPDHLARLYFTVDPGPKSVIGPIHIEGLGELPEGPVRRALDLAPGDPFSQSDLDAAQRAVLDLGTFAVVTVTPVLSDPPRKDGVVPLVVRLELQKLKSVILGGGVEVDATRTEVHGRVGWEHKNLFGGFRHFIVDLRPGLQLYPTRLPSLEAPTALLPEERLRLELRQPGFLEARTNVSLRQELNTYPLQLSPEISAKDVVPGYFEYHGSIGLDRSFGKLFVAPTYNFQWNHPFPYGHGRLNPALVDVTLSYVDILAQLDLRDDRLRPHEGLFLQNDLQVAGLLGDAHDVRIQPEVRGYVPLGKHVTLAARATVGFLFPRDQGARSPGAASLDAELVYLRGFFSGGPSSNRGYPIRGVGPHGRPAFIDPNLQSPYCNPQSPSYDLARCSAPLGGLSLWEASLEVRFPLAGPLGGVTFCDASDVSPYRLDIRLDHPHLSCGLGLRYETPIGPVRVDAGFRIPGAQLPRGVDPRVDSDPTTIYGFPLALAFGIGEAF